MARHGRSSVCKLRHPGNGAFSDTARLYPGRHGAGSPHAFSVSTSVMIQDASCSRGQQIGSFKLNAPYQLELRLVLFAYHRSWRVQDARTPTLNYPHTLLPLMACMLMLAASYARAEGRPQLIPTRDV